MAHPYSVPNTVSRDGHGTKRTLDKRFGQNLKSKFSLSDDSGDNIKKLLNVGGMFPQESKKERKKKGKGKGKERKRKVMYLLFTLYYI